MHSTPNTEPNATPCDPRWSSRPAISPPIRGLGMNQAAARAADIGSINFQTYFPNSRRNSASTKSRSCQRLKRQATVQPAKNPMGTLAAPRDGISRKVPMTADTVHTQLAAAAPQSRPNAGKARCRMPSAALSARLAANHRWHVIVTAMNADPRNPDPKRTLARSSLIRQSSAASGQNMNRTERKVLCSASALALSPCLAEKTCDSSVKETVATAMVRLDAMLAARKAYWIDAIEPEGRDVARERCQAGIRR